MVNWPMVLVSPLRIGPHGLNGLYVGVVLTTYKSWDDPPSTKGFEGQNMFFLIGWSQPETPFVKLRLSLSSSGVKVPHANLNTVFWAAWNVLKPICHLLHVWNIYLHLA